ncbi:uncharacterized protein LOC115743350 [Rhodamnia argentea]|uniref:Uncharacterized protein LOC115743350 n=1 Tax=Rhodamnia argentea TaxID=178133 RepID=A0A8B8PGM2_9MYRT|nr:uncharacterized protein LOC115743350 [Rhodamnia argentea]
MLRSAPSFSVFVSTDDEDGHHRPEEASEAGEALRRTTTTIADGVPAVCSEEFSFGRKAMGSIEEEGDDDGAGNAGGAEESGCRNDSSAGDDVEREPASPPMYIAAGLGIGNADFGGESNGGLALNPPEFDGLGDAEEYYERMVNEFPCHPLFLRNYAQVLQSKGDLHEAEDYSYRATLANPEDGEILAQYAKIVWDLYHDKERALTYYERAAQAAANDSHVLAAYAGFLWEIEDENVTDGVQENHLQGNLDEKDVLTSEKDIPVTGFDIANFTATCTDGKNVEENYKQMIEEDPSNPLILRSYAQFLYQGKQDLEGAEEYYSRTILADPMDVEALVMSAKLVWQLHRDHDKATSYFERAIQATPTESHILAAYASFLWETENDDEDES